MCCVCVCIVCVCVCLCRVCTFVCVLSVRTLSVRLDVHFCVSIFVFVCTNRPKLISQTKCNLNVIYNLTKSKSLSGSSYWPTGGSVFFSLEKREIPVNQSHSTIVMPSTNENHVIFQTGTFFREDPSAGKCWSAD